VLKSIIVFCLTFILISCSSTKEVREEVNEEVAQTRVKDSKALGETIEELINSSKHLNEAQKKQLNKIFVSNKARAQELAERSFKLRAVLVEELLSEKINRHKIGVLKREIKQIENLRLKNTFDAIEQVSSIVNTHPERSKFATHLKGMDRMSIR
jgi:hypothetical protein